MSDTPRTDEAESASDMKERVPAWFCRQLERELSDAKAQYESCHSEHVRSAQELADLRNRLAAGRGGGGSSN